MTSRRAFVTAAVRGVAFALVTALFTAVPCSTASYGASTSASS